MAQYYSTVKCRIFFGRLHSDQHRSPNPKTPHPQFYHKQNSSTVKALLKPPKPSPKAQNLRSLFHLASSYQSGQRTQATPKTSWVQESSRNPFARYQCVDSGNERAGIVPAKPSYLDQGANCIRSSDVGPEHDVPSSRADPRDIGLLCNRCVSYCVSICLVYIRRPVYATYPRFTGIGQCAAVCAGYAVAWRGVARHGTKHMSIRPHNGNITAI